MARRLQRGYRMDGTSERIEMEIEGALRDPFRWGPVLAVMERAIAGRLGADDLAKVIRRFAHETARDVVRALSVRVPVDTPEDPAPDDDTPTAVIRRSNVEVERRRMAWEDTAVQEVGRGA